MKKDSAQAIRVAPKFGPCAVDIEIPHGHIAAEIDHSFSAKGPAMVKVVFGSPEYISVRNSSPRDYISRDESLDMSLDIEEIGAGRRDAKLREVSQDLVTLRFELRQFMDFKAAIA